jgi:DNA repair photolyase
MKTAVQWLKEQYIDRGETIPSGVFQEALEKEKEQMIRFHKWMLKNDILENSEKYFHYDDNDMLNEYYNQTYNQDRELGKEVTDLLENYKKDKTFKQKSKWTKL